MRIWFLTGSIAPGMDGVGDYTLRLAEECRARGHQCDVISYNDRHTSEPKQGGDFLRLPLSAPWANRQKAFGLWASARPQPDWTSLQFVPYAMNRKGVVCGWGKRLRPMIRDTRLHVMFHEIWIGVSPETPFRHKVMGRVQCFFLKRMLSSLRPRMMHTSNTFYVNALAKEGLKARELPLFGNIRFERDSKDAGREILLQKLRLTKREDAWIFVIFGALHPIWPPEPLLSKLIEAGQANQKKVCIVSMGRIGPGQELWNQIAAKYENAIQFLQLGELSSREISGILQEANFGISTTPYEILGKSSTVATMREHGLPVLVNRVETTPNPATVPADVLLLDRWDKLPAISPGEPKGPEASVGRFLDDLQKPAV